MKTCFVIIPYDTKTDFSSGQQYNMENSYENLIKPVFEKLGIECFRAKDKQHSGVIDAHMYRWIFDADIVVADLTTWNPNVMYELGIRHAVKPFTTILISDEKARSNRVPFDLNHVSINFYKHLGEDIGASEARRFCNVLESLVKEILGKQNDVDSPLYTFLQDLKPPLRSQVLAKQVVAENKPMPDIAERIKAAEKARRNNDLAAAKELFEECLRLSPKDTFIIQRTALVTYKLNPRSKTELEQAEKLLKQLDPEFTTDPETLGLLGAIYKRRFDLSREQADLDQAVKYYARGFYVKQDYYNGINYAFMLTLKAEQSSDRVESLGHFANSNFVRRQVIEICQRLIHQPDFNDRPDQNWVYLTLAEAHIGLGEIENAQALMPAIEALSEGPFDFDTFNKQTGTLQQLVGSLKERYSIA